jgi:Skp family chaperone for outer membrane proteins
MSLKSALKIGAAALLLAVLATAAAPAAAQGGKFAVINTQEIVFESQSGKAALEQVKTLQEQKEAEAQAKQLEITDLQDRISEGCLSLPDDVLAESLGAFYEGSDYGR